MNSIYNLIARIAWFHLKIVARFNSKIKLFVDGRKQTNTILSNSISKQDHVIWVHASSLGEFEQGLPVIEQLKSIYSSSKILVTFFSPSGYEVKKNTDAADVITYLPIDTKRNVKRFIQLANPKLAIFIKYEIWPNYLKELKAQEIPSILVSAIFKKEQIYFKWFGGFMRNSLRNFNHIFVQNEKSQLLLKSIHFSNTTIAGDTRLDRVSEILERDNSLSFMKAFCNDKLCVVAGSTWPEDETILIDYINHTTEKVKFVIAPHTIRKDKILGLMGAITKKTTLYSNINESNLAQNEVLIIDTIGLLTKIYSYANIVYVGGGFETGLHNTLEPAAFGVPVIIGPKYKGFKEAEDLVQQKGIFSITTNWDFNELMKKLVENSELRNKSGAINSRYISKNKGASIQIVDHIRTLL